MKISTLAWFLAVVFWTPLWSQETSEKNLLQTNDLFFEEKNRVETRGFADPQLPSPKRKKSTFVNGGEAEIHLRKKKKKNKGNPKAMDSDVEYDDLQMDTVQTRDDPRRPKPPPKKVKATVAPKDFIVKTYKVARKEPPRTIKLVFPPHNSTLSAGIIKFEWDSNGNLAKKRMDLIVERLSSRERYIHRSGRLNKKVYFGPGEYRWQVACPSQNEESKWRIFRVIEMKANRRRPSSKR